MSPLVQTAGPSDLAPTWSPDAARIAFVSNDDIAVMDAAGGNASWLTNTATREAMPAWSPDGRRIAFLSDADGPWKLFLMNADGSGAQPLTAGVQVGLSRPTWSPDSSRIGFTCELEEGNEDICVIDAAGTQLTRLTNDPARDTTAAWSPDGGRIAFATNRYGTELQLALMRADGTGVSPIGGGIIGRNPAWSPDGQQIAFEGMGLDWFGLYVMKADGSEITWLADWAADAAWVSVTPVARFSIHCDGLVCTFDGSLSVGDIASYHWDFGDQTTGSGSIANHTYVSGGSLTITLTVTDADGATATARQTVYLNQPPVASFTVSCEALTCIFDWAASYDPDGYGLGVGWDFGDGTGGWLSVDGTSTKGLHTYPGPGTYTATIRVSDQYGVVTRASQTIALAAPVMHIGDLDSSKTLQPGTWSAAITVEVHDSGHRPVGSAAVAASWNDGIAASCTTDAAGRCTVYRASIPNKKTVTLTIRGVARNSFVYDPAGNHDPDGDSNGTAIRLSRQ